MRSCGPRGTGLDGRRPSAGSIRPQCRSRHQRHLHNEIQIAIKGVDSRFAGGTATRQSSELQREQDAGRMIGPGRSAGRIWQSGDGHPALWRNSEDRPAGPVRSPGQPGGRPHREPDQPGRSSPTREIAPARTGLNDDRVHWIARRLGDRTGRRLPDRLPTEAAGRQRFRSKRSHSGCRSRCQRCRSRALQPTTWITAEASAATATTPIAPRRARRRPKDAAPAAALQQVASSSATARYQRKPEQSV